MARLAAIVACALAVVPIAVVGGRKLGDSGVDASVDATLVEARDAMRSHAWDAPPGRNFKEITAAGLARFPGNTRLQDLRRDAAERLVSEALGRKYAGDTEQALHYVRLALEWNPGLGAAQHLAAELEGTPEPDVAPTPSAAPIPGDRGGKGPRKPGVRAPDLRSATPTASAAPAPSGAELPPSPTPPPPTPPPSSTGPWL